MLSVEFETIKYYQFENLRDLPMIHGVFTRKGGVSPDPWASLNLGGTVGDSRKNVIENRRRIFRAIQRPVESIYDAWQVHGTTVLYPDQPRQLDSPHVHGDVILTNNPDVTLLMRFADCVPILLYDPVKKVVGLAHAGWKGSIGRIAQIAVQAMQEKFGVNPHDILAGIGPSICSTHYIVGEEVRTYAMRRVPDLMEDVFYTKKEALHLDLWKLNELILKNSGVFNVQVAEQCTACNVEEWYSHRAESGKTGRFAVLLALKKGSHE